MGGDQELGAFKLNRFHDVCFLPMEPTADPTGESIAQNTVGSLVPRSSWSTPFTSIVWSTKWAINGLTPVRPLVMLTTQLVLPPNKTLQLFENP